MMLCYSKISKIKYFLDPPPKKKRLKDMNGRDMSTRTSVCLYNQPVIWIFTRSRLSSLSDSDNKVIPSLTILSNYSRFFMPIFQHLLYLLYIGKHTKFQRKGHSLLKLFNENDV